MRVIFSATRFRCYFVACLLAAGAPGGNAAAQSQPSIPVPDAMANQPDPADFITRADTNLSSLGSPLRFGGMNISWLGLRSDIGRDSGRAEDVRTPTAYEIDEAFNTVQAMGAGYIRIASLVAPAGCALCLTPAAGQTNPQALAYADHLLKLARDAGLKIVVPLAGAGHCASGGAGDPVAATQCVFADARGLPEAAFYSDAHVRADFARHVTALLNHVNPETGRAWKEDSTIMAWENCDGCGTGMDPAVLADWTEFLGRAIKAVDGFHLYENGAFAGRLGKQPGAIDAARLALPSVDIIGDRIAPPPGTAPAVFDDAQNAVNAAGRVYVIDSYAWTPSHWATEDDFHAFLTAMVKNRALAGAFLSDLGGLAGSGGWLPPTRPDEPPLYFPGAPVSYAGGGHIDVATMTPRARAVRHFSYSMMDLEPTAFATPQPPEIISVIHGKVTWRGSAGAVNYSISRSTDLTETGSWTTLCDQCATDANPIWQDTSVPSGNVWYRLTPYNANMHPGLPSDPAQNR